MSARKRGEIIGGRQRWLNKRWKEILLDWFLSQNCHHDNSWESVCKQPRILLLDTRLAEKRLTEKSPAEKRRAERSPAENGGASLHFQLVPVPERSSGTGTSWFLKNCFPALFQSSGPQPARDKSTTYVVDLRPILFMAREANVKSMYRSIRLLFQQPDRASGRLEAGAAGFRSGPELIGFFRVACL